MSSHRALNWPGLDLEIKGTVTATGADGDKRYLSFDSSVYQGDVIETWPASEIKIVLRYPEAYSLLDATTFLLGADAKLTLDELNYTEGLLRMSLDKGKFVFITGKDAATQVIT